MNAVASKSSSVLLTGAGGAASESIYSQWKNRYELFFADAEVAAIPPVIPRERCLSIPFADHPLFVDELEKAVKHLEINVVVPCVDEELCRMAELSTRCDELTILAPPSAFSAMMLDKLVFAQEAARRGLDVPRTVVASSRTEMSYPCIAKPRSGRGSRNVMVLDGEQQVASYVELCGKNSDEYILQERILGIEYTVYVSADRSGALRNIVPVKVLQKRGITIRAETDFNDEVLRYCESFHDAFKPSGPYNIQLMLQSDGRVLPFEVNPRVSTTFSLAIAAGADPIATLTGPEPEPDARLTHPRLALRRYWLNAISTIS